MMVSQKRKEFTRVSQKRKKFTRVSQKRKDGTEEVKVSGKHPEIKKMINKKIYLNKEIMSNKIHLL